MPTFESSPILVRSRLKQTNDGSAITNAYGLQIADSSAAVTAARQFWIYQATATAGNQPLYQVGYGGVSFAGVNGNAINIPAGATSVIGVIPAGSRIENVNWILEQAPTAITGGSLSVALDGVTIGSFVVGTSIGANYTFTPTTVLAGLQKLSMVGPTDSVLTVSLAGTGITGGILASISVNFTFRNFNGNIVPQGQGLTNS